MPFDSPDISLGDLLKSVSIGKAQLPDFQREWKWDNDRIVSLLASISLGYPVGVVMMLELGGADVRFAPRPISGVDLAGLQEPEQLILDGQQRLTSLYQSLFSPHPVDTTDSRGKRLSRWYYIDIKKALDPEGDREEIIFGVPEERIRRNFRGEIELDLSSRDKEFQEGAFPLNLAYDTTGFLDWQLRFVLQDDEGPEARMQAWKQFHADVLNNFISYTVPVIVLKKETPKEAVCTVFEKVNTGGITLNVFELLTATFAASDFKLNEDWKARKARLHEFKALRSVEDTDFLQAISLLASRERRQRYIDAGGHSDSAPGVSCKRKDILNLQLDEYQAWADSVEAGLVWAASFLAGEHIFQAPDLPYRTQLVPLAAIHVALGRNAELIGVTDKLRQWYWCGVLGELYGGTTESRFVRDLTEVVAWVEGGSPASTVVDAQFNPARLLTLKTRGSAAYKGVSALLMRGGCRDWIFDKAIDLAAFFTLQIDIHHIFPRKWCLANNIDPTMRESIVNKTPISATTNQIIGGRAPSFYVPIVMKRGQTSEATLTEILATHSVNEELLAADDFAGFFESRRKALLQLIGGAMGKEIFEASADETPDQFEEEAPEPDDDDGFPIEEAS